MTAERIVGVYALFVGTVLLLAASVEAVGLARSLLNAKSDLAVAGGVAVILVVLNALCLWGWILLAAKRRLWMERVIDEE